MTAFTDATPSRQVRRALARACALAGPGRPRPAPRIPEETPGKGLYDGNCNRTACQRPIRGANWFNLSTRAYYCQSCALMLNRESGHYDGIRVCVHVETPEDQPSFPYDEMRRIRAERTGRAG